MKVSAGVNGSGTVRGRITTLGFDDPVRRTKVMGCWKSGKPPQVREYPSSCFHGLCSIPRPLDQCLTGHMSHSNDFAEADGMS